MDNERAETGETRLNLHNCVKWNPNLQICIIIDQMIHDDEPEKVYFTVINKTVDIIMFMLVFEGGF